MMHRTRELHTSWPARAMFLAVLCVLGLAQAAIAAPPKIQFTSDVPDTYVRGSGESIAFTVEPELPAGSDVLVIAWSHDEKRMVDEFAHTLTEEPWVITPENLDQLPTGRVQLQLMPRVPGEGRPITSHWIQVEEGNLPGISFPDTSLLQYTRGSGETVPFELDGPLPTDADVLVLAWSEDEQRMVDEFAHTLNQEPWQIGAARMDSLPSGSIVLQLFTRLGDERNSANRRVEMLSALPTLSFPDAPSSYQIGSGQGLSYQVNGTVPSGSTLTATAYQNGTQITNFVHELPTPSGTIDAAQLDTLPTGSVELHLTLAVPDRENVTATHTLSVQAPALAELPGISFPSSTPATYTQGSGDAVPFELDGELPEGADVLVLAWSDEQRQMVDEFAHTLTEGPWQIGAADMNKLPAGPVVLQVFTRLGDERKSAYHQLDVLAPMPALSFTNAPTSYQIGSGDTVGYQIDGNVPSGSSLRASAYQNGSEITSFAHELPTSDGAIDAVALDGLPTGSVELRLSLSSPDRQDVTASLALSVEAAPSDDGTTDDSGTVTVPTVNFAADTPSTYTRGSGETISFTVDGELPEGGDILAIAWSDDEQRLVDEFAHSYTGEPWTIPSSQLDLLPAGGTSLQLLVRVPDHDSVRVAHWLNVETVTSGDGTTDDGTTDDGTTDDGTTDDGTTDDGTTDDGTTDDGTTDDGTTDDGTTDDGSTDDGSSGGSVDTGWTDLSQFEVDQKIYVSSSEGDDNNDGLSANSPVKTLKRGYGLIRNGRADWLLLKSGDVWDQNTSGSGRWFATNNWTKGGRSQSAPLVVTTYGGNARAVLKNISLRQSWEVESSYVCFVNIEFYASGRDPGSADYGRISSIHDNGFEWRYGEHILFEGCKVHFYERDNVMFLNGANPSSRFVRNIKIRRNIIANSWSHGQHSQGLKTDEVDHILIEENIFDHNGWNLEAGAEKEGFNHNLYLTNTRYMVMRNNISSRSSFDGVKLAADKYHGVSEVEIVNNLFIGNRLAFNLSGTASASERGHHNVTIARNVVATGTGAEGSFQGSDGLDLTENLFLEKVADNNQPVLKFSDSYQHYNIAITKNIVHERPTSWPDLFDAPSGATVKDNLVELDPERYEDPTRMYYDVAGSDSEFFKQLYRQSKSQWQTEYTADKVNQWIRSGFSLVPTYD